MLSIGGISFLMPFALLGFIILPVIWWLVRLTPPLAYTIKFPAIILLGKLKDVQADASTLPWWLMMLRMLMVALLIIGAALPVMNPQEALRSNGPLVVIVDNGWASAKHWSPMISTARDLIIQAGRQDRQVLIVPTSSDRTNVLPAFMPSDKAIKRLETLAPNPWSVDRNGVLDVLFSLSTAGSTVWLSDGLSSDGIRDGASDVDRTLIATLQQLGPLSIYKPDAGTEVAVLSPPEGNATELSMAVIRANSDLSYAANLIAYDTDNHAAGRATAWFKPGDLRANAIFEMPSEVRNRLSRIEIEGQNTAGATLLLDERWRRRPIGLVSESDLSEAQLLLSNSFYLSRAFEPLGRVHHGSIAELLDQKIAVLVLTDPPLLSPQDETRVQEWMKAGGLLITFAGPRLSDNSQSSLLPVTLRDGDRIMGGSMAWRRPASIAPFNETSPYHGLEVPSDVAVSRQVLAKPAFDLENKIWAQLSDGTPLVTAKPFDQGWSVLFHVTANAEWSSLPLSGLFVEMLQKTIGYSRGLQSSNEGQVLSALKILDGYGYLKSAPPLALSIIGKEFPSTVVSQDHPPGFYGNNDVQQALNLGAGIKALSGLKNVPESVNLKSYQDTYSLDLTAWFFMVVLILFLLDIIASFWLRGLIANGWGLTVFVIVCLSLSMPVHAQSIAGSDDDLIRQANLERMAYVVTGERDVDEASLQGLLGLRAILKLRTAIELDPPIGIDLELDRLIFFPLIYWPLAEGTSIPSPQAAKRINTYMDNGGTVLFDARTGNNAAGSSVLQRFARVLDIPHLIPVPSEHVLTRSFYLLGEFPGRWTGGKVWLVPPEERINDGVSPIIVGTHGWADAWAMDDMGEPLYAVIPGGERQRELSYRFGVNLMMYVLTGNYKNDQVHLKSIVERLGQ